MLRQLKMNFGELVSILIDNACKYCDDFLTKAKRGKRAHLTVSIVTRTEKKMLITVVSTVSIARMNHTIVCTG